MKKILALFALASSIAMAGETITISPGTYRDTDFVRVYCHDWSQAHPASTDKIVHLDADHFRSCTYSTLTYQRHQLTRVTQMSPLEFRSQPGDRRLDLLEMERDHRSDYEKMLDEERRGFEIMIPLYYRRF